MGKQALRDCHLAKAVIKGQSQYLHAGHTCASLLCCLTATLFFHIKAIFLNFKSQTMILLWAGGSRVGEDGRKQSVCADGMVTVAPNQEITAWAEEGFGLDITLPCILVRLTYVGARPADGRCWAGRRSQPCQSVSCRTIPVPRKLALWVVTL